MDKAVPQPPLHILQREHYHLSIFHNFVFILHNLGFKFGFIFLCLLLSICQYISMFQLFSDQCLATSLFHDKLSVLGDLSHRSINFIMPIILSTARHDYCFWAHRTFVSRLNSLSLHRDCPSFLFPMAIVDAMASLCCVFDPRTTSTHCRSLVDQEQTVMEPWIR